MEKYRLFIAADISEEQRQATLQLIESLQKGIRFTKAYPKWVETNALHITLKFLGDIEASRVDRITHTLDSKLLGAKSFNFCLSDLGVFPNEHQPRVLWVGVREGADAMDLLQNRVDSALEAAGFERDIRPFHPHLTLARIKAMRGVEALMDVIHSHRKREIGAALLDHLTLYRSHLSPDGARHVPFQRWQLAPDESPKKDS